MTFWIILVIAGFLTLLSLRYRNLLFSFSGMLGWIGLWAYHQNHPPANVVQGTFLYELLLYIFIIMGLAVMFLYFWNRSRGYTGYPRTAKEQAAYDNEVRTFGDSEKGLMELNETEYRVRVRRSLRSRRK